MLLPAKDGKEHRDLELDIMQRMKDSGIFSPKSDFSFKSLFSGLGEPLWKRRWKDYKAQRGRKTSR